MMSFGKLWKALAMLGPQVTLEGPMQNVRQSSWAASVEPLWELLDNAWEASATSPVHLEAPLTL